MQWASKWNGQCPGYWEFSFYWVNQVVNKQRNEAAEYTQIVSGAVMEIFRRLGWRIAGEVTLGGVIRESLSAEEPATSAEEQEDACRGKGQRKGIWGRTKLWEGMMLSVFWDPKQSQGAGAEWSMEKREMRQKGHRNQLPTSNGGFLPALLQWEVIESSKQDSDIICKDHTGWSD